MVNSDTIDFRGASADKKPMRKRKPAEMTAGKLIGIKSQGRYAVCVLSAHIGVELINISFNIFSLTFERAGRLHFERDRCCCR